jgi:hypothetical protein
MVKAALNIGTTTETSGRVGAAADTARRSGTSAEREAGIGERSLAQASADTESFRIIAIVAASDEFPVNRALTGLHVNALAVTGNLGLQAYKTLDLPGDLMSSMRATGTAQAGASARVP